MNRNKIKALNDSIAANEAARKIRIEMEAFCGDPYCGNKRRHKVNSGKCKPYKERENAINNQANNQAPEEHGIGS